MVKQKGITLDRANDQVVNFETMKDMVLNNKELKSMERHQFKWDNQTKDIVTKYIARSIKSTVKENVQLMDTTHYPLDTQFKNKTKIKYVIDIYIQNDV